MKTHASFMSGCIHGAFFALLVQTAKRMAATDGNASAFMLIFWAAIAYFAGYFGMQRIIGAIIRFVAARIVK